LQELFCKAALFDSTGNAKFVTLSQRVSRMRLFDRDPLLLLSIEKNQALMTPSSI
jgi:hypothetical protein